MMAGLPRPCIVLPPTVFHGLVPHSSPPTHTGHSERANVILSEVEESKPFIPDPHSQSSTHPSHHTTTTTHAGYHPNTHPNRPQSATKTPWPGRTRN